VSAPPSVADLIDESLALERAGDIAGALGRAREALDVARPQGDPEATASALVAVARFRHRLGQYLATRALAEEALALAPPETPAQADALLMLAMCAAETEFLVEAEGYYRRAIDLAREIGYHLLRFRVLNNLAVGVYFSRGQFDLAEAALQEALRLGRDLREDDRLPYTLLALAWLYQFTGQRQRTRETLAELDKVAYRVAGARGYHANLSALLALDEGDLDAAPPLFAAARSVAEAIGEPRLNVETRLGLSRYHRLAGDPATARTWADEALALTTRVGFSLLQGRALIERGRTHWDVGNGAAAERDFRAAGEVLTPLEADFDLARAALFLAALLHDQQRPEARQVWQDAARRIIGGGYAFLLEQERALAFPLVAAHLNDPDPETAALSAALLTHLERVPPPPLQVVTLGRFAVRQGARVVPEAAWRQRRAGELFRLLLVSHGQALSRDEVIEAFWPEKSPEAANTPFHQATSALRRALEPDLPDKFPSRYLEVEGGRVALHLPPGSWVDCAAFEQHVRQGEWEAAVALYGGDLFPDDRYADWAAAPRERLAQMFVAAALTLARAALDAGHPQEALNAARRVLETDPWQENAVLVGMKACLALDDRAGALRLYRSLERALRQDLDVAPQAELQTFYRSLCG